MLLNNNQKKERTEMRKIRRDAKTFELNLETSRGTIASPCVNLDSIARDEHGMKTIYIVLPDGTSIHIANFENDRTLVNVIGHDKASDSTSKFLKSPLLRLENESRRTVFIDESPTGREYDVANICAKSEKIQVELTIIEK